MLTDPPTNTPMCNAGSRGEANSCLRPRCSGLPVPFGAKFAALASRGPLECATDIALCEPSGRLGAHSAGCQGGNMSEGVSPSPRGTRPGFSVHTHNLLGGLIVTVLALLLLGFAFYVPNTVVPRFMLAALAVVGIAAAVGFLPVHSPRDFYGGIAFVLLPAFALIASAELLGQRGLAFGPGTAQRLFLFVLAAVGSDVVLGMVYADASPYE